MQLMSMMLVRDRMTPSPVTLGPHEPLRRAVELFEKHRFRHLPVCQGGLVIGMVTDRDVRRSNPQSARTDLQAHQTYLDQTRAEQIMSRGVVTVSSATPMRQAVAILVEKKFGALPVVDDGKLVGILSQIDALKAFLDLI